MHGVGVQERGEVIGDLLRGLASHRKDAVYHSTTSDFVVRGTHYAVADVDHPRLKRIIEAYWGDIARPARGVFGVVRHLLDLLLAMSEVRVFYCLMLPRYRLQKR